MGLHRQCCLPGRARKTGSEQGWAGSAHLPKHTPSEGRGPRSQHTWAQAKPGAHVSTCVHLRSRVRVWEA